MNKMMRIGMSVVLVVGMLAWCAKAPAEGTIGNTENTKGTTATTPTATKPGTTTTKPSGSTKATEATKPTATTAPTKGTEGTKTTEGTKATENTKATEAPVTNHTHSYSTYTVAADCWNGGYDVHTCSCGDSYTDNYTSALGHNYESRTVAPTATEQGYTLHVCTRCSESYSDNYVPATGGSDAAEPTEHEHDLNPDGTCAIDGCTYRDEDVYQRWLENQKKHEEEEKNPYCPYCGYYKYSAEHLDGCIRFIMDATCYICGQEVPANTCHHH